MLPCFHAKKKHASQTIQKKHTNTTRKPIILGTDLQAVKIAEANRNISPTSKIPPSRHLRPGLFFCIGRVFHHHHRLSFGPWALNDESSHQSTGNDLSRKVEPTRSWKKPLEMGPPKSPTFCDSWGFLFIKNGSEIPPLSVLESGRILKISSDTLKHQYNRHCKTQGAKRAMFLAREPLKATQTPQVWEESSESSDMQWVWEAG